MGRRDQGHRSQSEGGPVFRRTGEFVVDYWAGLTARLNATWGWFSGGRTGAA